jgi:hypothetical protein
MRRPLRIAIELICPPLIAVILFVMVGPLRGGTAARLVAIPLLLPFAYFVAAVPTIAFTAAMEIAFSSGMRASDWRGIVLASGLGLVCGAAIGALFAGGLSNENHAFTTMLPIGAFAGGLTGLLVKSLT